MGLKPRPRWSGAESRCVARLRTKPIKQVAKATTEMEQSGIEVRCTIADGADRPSGESHDRDEAERNRGALLDCGVLLRKNPHQLLLQSIPLLFLLPGQYQIQGDGRIQGNRNDPPMPEKFQVAFGDETNRFSLRHCADNGFYPGSTDDLGMDPLPVKFLHTAVVYACVRMHEDERFFRNLAQSNAGLVIEISGRMSAGEDRYQLVPGQKICLEIFILYQFLADYDEIVFPIFYAFQKLLFFCFIKDD